MTKTPAKRDFARTAGQRRRERALRERYQRTRPTLAELEASGEYGPPISQGEYWDLASVLAGLRELRRAAGVSLAELSRRTGIDKAALSRLENTVNDNPSIETLARYADALGKRLIVKFVDSPSRGGNGRKMRSSGNRAAG